MLIRTEIGAAEVMMAESSQNTAVTAAPHVMLQTLPEDESVLLNTQTEGYFGLDRMGTHMWRALTGNPTVADAEATLVAEFDVEPEVLRADLQRFLQELVDRQLVDVRSA